jgi:3-methyladenine DNA glycosylase AlkD
MTATKVRAALRKVAYPHRAEASLWCFQTVKGEYGEGDKFLGVRVPDVRRVAKQFCELPLSETLKLLKSSIHEERQVALFILVKQFEKGGEAEREKVFTGYVRHMRYVNNWDLVDGSAPQIIGGHLVGKEHSQLDKWARSRDLWKRRIAIMATFQFIKAGKFTDTLRIAGMLLNDKEDLIHKAVGWMLREVGNRDRAVEERFLKRHYKAMPRTMLRYAIEKFPEKKRKAYLKSLI